MLLFSTVSCIKLILLFTSSLGWDRRHRKYRVNLVFYTDYKHNYQSSKPAQWKQVSIYFCRYFLLKCTNTQYFSIIYYLEVEFKVSPMIKVSDIFKQALLIRSGVQHIRNIPENCSKSMILNVRESMLQCHIL